MEYKFTDIEEKWKKIWEENAVYKVTEDTTKPKYYVLDMFPYPSGAGLHVGHPLGYVASDIYARYKRLKGFNVLHPMGWDAFGLPAEQYAIETGTHPALTTDVAIKRYRQQMDKIGFSFDWSREVRTCEPDYYKWTQWIFLKLYGSWYNKETNKAEPIGTLIAKLSANSEWNAKTEAEKQRELMNHRLAFQSYSEVNWCAALGTVLANDEIKDGKSERGGHLIERRKMRQWFLRITEYSDRLLDGLDKLDWSDAMKEMQRNWIGRSEGALVKFKVHLSPTLSEGEGANSQQPKYYTTDGQIWNTSLPNAKEMRKNPTEAEAIVWDRLKASQLGFKFRRQHPVDQYIPDFVCLKKGLVVEIDGKIHDTQKETDEERTQQLERYGFTVIRFTNEEVIANTETVIQKIQTALANLKDRNSDDETAVEVPPSKKHLSPALSEGEGVKTKHPSNGPAVEVPPSEGFREVALEVFTTRPDTIFGATFMVIAAENELVDALTTPEQKAEVEKYIAYVKSRTDVERQQEKKVTGVFTGSYAVNPFNNENIPVYIAEYVLGGYGTGAIMAVPADDERDKKFAEKFGLKIVEVIDKSMYPGATIEDKLGKMINSDFVNGMEVKDAIKAVIAEVEKRGIGEKKVNYKQRDAGYSRQRYWGEPFPIKYEVIGQPDPPFAGGETDDIPVPLSADKLPLILPEVSSYKPSGDGRAPLANSEEWVKNGYETDTMPGYAASSWYFLRYMDPKNKNEFAAKDKIEYWQNVDIYFGGAEHAVGHLLYSRFWNMFLYDLGLVPFEEPFKKLVNQGMIQGVSKFVFKLHRYYMKPANAGELIETVPDIYVTKELAERIEEEKSKDKYSEEVDTILREKTEEAQVKFQRLLKTLPIDLPPNAGDNSPKEIENYKLSLKKNRLNSTLHYSWEVTKIHVDVKLVDGDVLDIDKSLTSQRFTENDLFIVGADGKFICASEPEKMSKSKLNVVSPDDVIEKYGADCFRMFEMFLGPIEQSKPWDDKGISGVSNFLRKFWRLFYDDKGWKVSDAEPSDAEYKVLHKTIKKIAEDIERLNFNTSVSAFMIATNELGGLNSSKKKILEPLLICLAPFAPFITEELWSALGNKGSIHTANYPKVEEKYLTESEFDYPVSINGKVRAQVKLSLDLTAQEVEKQVLELDKIKQYTNNAAPKKFIFVKGKIINVVV